MAVQKYRTEKLFGCIGHRADVLKLFLKWNGANP